jgi:tryptophan halogenase
MRLTIIGGGSAGWMSALFLKKRYPHFDITVVNSSKLDILGAGEGTVGNSNYAFEYMELDPFEFIKRTKSSIKTGVKFTGWSKHNPEYFMGLAPVAYEDSSIYPQVLATAVKEDGNLDRLSMYSRQAYSNRLPLLRDKLDPKYIKDPAFVWHMSVAWHFDARLLAAFLGEKAEERGVKIIDNIVSGFNTDDSGNINKVIFEDESEIDCDFLIDCTGFQRLVIGKHFKSEWIDYKPYLPLDTGLAFTLPVKEELPPYTELIAMNAGWVFNIPVQHRTGAGYLYASKYITEEEAIKEIKEKYGDVQIIKKFNFNAGHYKESWINNCIAIGLSSGFLEPMEATTIHGTIRMLNKIIETYDLENYTQKDVDSFNKHVHKFYEDCRDFIAIHYITNRDDFPFWRDYMKDNKISDNLIKFLDKIKENPVYSHEDMDSWKNDLHKVYYGTTGMDFNGDRLLEEIKEKDYSEELKRIDNKLNSELDNYIKSKDFFDMIMNDEWTIK